jgi:AraC family transcriptional regulator
MNLQPRIENLKEKKLVGKRIQMSFSENKTFELWHSFMPRRKEITSMLGSDLFSVEVYPAGFYDQFNPATIFEKWAAVEVTDHSSVPDGMETITLPNGLYAVFLHQGPASEGPKTYQYIFGIWLSNSDYILDNRPHFALMGEKYKNNEPDSEEELWIPVKPK